MIKEIWGPPHKKKESFQLCFWIFYLKCSHDQNKRKSEGANSGIEDVEKPLNPVKKKEQKKVTGKKSHEKKETGQG